MSAPKDKRIGMPRAIEAAWPDLLANLQAAYADLVNTRFDLERRAAELQESHDLLREVIAVMSEALFLVDRAGRIVQVNPAACELLNCDEAALVGHFFSQVCSGPDVPITPWAILSRSPRGSVNDLTTTLRAQAGENVPVRLSCSVVRDRVGKINGVLVIAQDERPTILLQQQLVQAGRRAAYERLASALAEELKTPLATLAAELDHLSKTVRRGQPIAESDVAALHRLQEVTARLTAIGQHLREFGASGHGAFAPLDMNELVEKTLLLVELQISTTGIQLIRELSPGLRPVQADAQELEHVILSLIANGCEAMETELRCLTLRTWSSQGQVIVAVSDTGKGIPSDLLPRIFNPFFTTKPPGVGLGLGLAYSREVLLRHGGTLRVESQPGEGTTVTLSLPALRLTDGYESNAPV